MGAEDSLLMRCSRRLAEGALSKGSRSSETGPLSGHRGDSHCPLAAPAPSAQARPGTNHSLWEDRDSWAKGTLRHSLAFLPRGKGLTAGAAAAPPVADAPCRQFCTTAPALACRPGGGTNLLDSPVNLGRPTALSATLRPL